jgi:hypothetical protein
MGSSAPVSTSTEVPSSSGRMEGREEPLTMLTTLRFFPFSTTVVYRFRFCPGLASSSSDPSAIGESLVPSFFTVLVDRLLGPAVAAVAAAASALAAGPGFLDLGLRGVLYEISVTNG